MNTKIFSILIFAILFILPTITWAQNPMNMPMGGRVLMSMPCTCSGGWYNLIFDNTTSAPLATVFQFGVSRLNQQYNIFGYGQHLLGSYQTGGVCEIYIGTGCSEVPVQGMITTPAGPGIGTSLY
jgi:hypothetical protein